MSAVDITVDTNVLMHACNPTEPRCAHALVFLTALLAGTVSLAVDEGFDLDESKNQSLICAEYLGKLVHGSIAYSVVVELAANRRISMVPQKIHPQKNKKLNQMLANRRDRTFVKVCVNSVGKAFVSHDFMDFSCAKRKGMADEFGINIVEADKGSNFI